MANIREQIVEALASLNPRIEADVINVFADREADRKCKAMVKVIDELDTRESELKKFGPDMVSYNKDGVKIDENFSKVRIEQRQKLEARILKLTNALSKALDKKDWSDVFKLSSGKDTSKDSTGNNEEDDSQAV